MTGKVKISFLVVVWSIVAIQMFINYQQEEERTVTAFSVMDDSISEERIRGYAYYGTSELNYKNKKRILENLALKLGITDGYEFIGGMGDSYTKTVLTKTGKYADTSLQIISIDESEQYIVTDIRTDASSKNAYALYEKVKDVYKEMGLDAQVGMEIDAERRGNYLWDGRDDIFDEILSVVKAKKVDEIVENGICTIYGYTKKEEDYLTLNNQKVNIQVVMSYDEEENTTYIKIGMPIVNSSY